MAVIAVENCHAEIASLEVACEHLAATIGGHGLQPDEHTMWRRTIHPVLLDELLVRVRGAERVFFKSRNSSFALAGFGAADKIFSSHSDAHLHTLVDKAKTLFDDQVYFGAMRFDEAADIAVEWRDFGKELFILPLVTIINRDGHCVLCVNFRSDGHLDWPVFQDRAITLLRALMREEPIALDKPLYQAQSYLPTKERYAFNIHRALNAFIENASHKKVVIGRRNCFTLGAAIDPGYLMYSLRENSRNAFLFFLDAGCGSAFFGVSPELLYRRHNRHIETESLAGTRARACDEAMDDSLRCELLDSLKDNQEHALVSLHIEERLKDFGTTNLSASKIEIMALTYVQHLLRRYHGTIGETVNDAAILKALHPSPAVCGLEIDWARNFIRQHEGFDRGFYAGPIGYIARDHAEFAVAIRSALFDAQQLYVYAACGIVAGSLYNQEWEELNNKEKSILCIFN